MTVFSFERGLIGSLLCVSILSLTVSAAAPAAQQPANARHELNLQQRKALVEALRPLDAQFDAAESMLRRPFSSPGYHTTLKDGDVHPTRDTLSYAVALLDTGEEARRQRALAILDRVISLQDQNPSSKTYGIWSWFLEEPLEKMSPPDWNWADFCGVALLQVVLYHRGRLPAEANARVDSAIQHAARSIQRRNVGPSYTNIAIMGTYVTLVAAETYGLADLKDYALARLKRFHDYSLEQGAFTEYNSPTYSIVALKELGRMRLHFNTAVAQGMVEDLYRMAWEQVARHFHVPTRQWAGPHSRCYRTLLDKEVLALIQRATDGRVDFGVNRPGLDDSRLPLPCPRDLESYFVTLPEARLEVQTFLKTNPPVVGSTFLDPLFTLGSVSRGDLWNQRRALLAYWGSAEQPAYLHLRFLHDDYDFTAAQFFSTQRGGTLLAGVDLAIDGGDTHPSLDRIKNATIKARDLRLRFELGGAAAGAPVPTLKKLSAPVKVVFGDLTLEIAVPLARFSDQLPHWEISRAPGKTCLDVVLYQGEERSFDLNRVQEAVIGFALRLSSTKAITSKLNPHASIEKGLATISLGDLRLCVPVKPAAIAELQQAVRSGPMMQE